MKMPGQENGGIEAAMNDAIPAGFTYLGQFIVHDLVTDRFAPTLRLEPLYGGGPDQSPKLYVRFENELPEPGWRVYKKLAPKDAMAHFEDVMMRVVRKNYAYDVPREEENTDRKGKASPEMGNASNDRNFLVSQIHCAFVRFHNAVAGWLYEKDNSLRSDALLNKAREIVTLHYQWLVVHQYLTMLVGEDVVKSLLRDDDGFRFFNPEQPARLMPEFSKAALRIGHSQVREIYVFPLLPGEKTTAMRKNKRVRLFISSQANADYEKKYGEYKIKNGEYESKNLIIRTLTPAPEKPKTAQELGDLRGGINRDNLVIDWSFFFDYSKVDNSKKLPQASLSIDHKLAEPLYDLFFLKERKSLPERDLKTSAELPTGYSLYLAYTLRNAADYPPPPLSSRQVSEVMGIEGLRVEDLPLWLYILLEAEINCGGKCLGTLGGRIVAEQIIWALKSDKDSFLNKKGGMWEPEKAFSKWRAGKLPNAVSDTKEAQKFCVLDLLQFPDYFFNQK